MRDLKKYLFHNLIQLSILASVFRHSSDYINESTSLINNFYNDQLNNRFNGPIDLMLINQDFYSLNTSILNSVNMRLKTQTYLNDIISLNNRLVLIAPATYLPSNKYQKTDSTGLLLLNNNNNNNTNKEDIEMDVDFQTMLEQDIDLGIMKHLTFETYDLASTSAGTSSSGTSSSNENSLDFDFFNYLNNGSMSKQQNNEFQQFKMPQQNEQETEENQKNSDILVTTRLFENQPVPDGYKLILEEDTGEWFLIMITNGTNKTELSRIQIRDPNHVNNLINSTNQTQTIAEPVEQLNIKLQNSIFLRPELKKILTEKENYTCTKTNDDTNEKSEELNFLSQVSITQELEKLNDNLIIESNNLNTTALTSSSVDYVVNQNNVVQESILDENLLNETWLNNFLNNSTLNTVSNLALTNECNKIDNKSNQYDQIKLNNDRMLFSLNQNESFLNDNQTFTLNTTNRSDNYLQQNDDMIYGDSSFEALLDQAILNHDLIKNQTYKLPNNELNLTDLLNYIDDDQNLQQQQQQSSNINLVNSNFSKILTLNSITNETHAIQTTTNNLTKNSKILIANDDDANFSKIEFKKEIIDLEDETTFKKKSNDFINSNQTHKEQNKKYSTSTTQRQSIILSTPSQETALNGFLHNHTYLSTTVNSEEESVVNHPYSYKNKIKKMLKNSKKTEHEIKHESRDELLLRENNINLTLNQVVETSADEFNELIRLNSLNHDQVNIVKDIRRRGKNKVAAQICRKRKLDSIDSLREDVDKLNDKKEKLIKERSLIQNELQEMRAKFDRLHHEAIETSGEPNNPILTIINDLKDQLNKNEIFNNNNNNSDNSVSSLSSYQNQETDDEHDEEDDDDDDDDAELIDDDSISELNNQNSETNSDFDQSSSNHGDSYVHVINKRLKKL